MPRRFVYLPTRRKSADLRKSSSSCSDVPKFARCSTSVNREDGSVPSIQRVSVPGSCDHFEELGVERRANDDAKTHSNVGTRDTRLIKGWRSSLNTPDGQGFLTLASNSCALVYALGNRIPAVTRQLRRGPSFVRRSPWFGGAWMVIESRNSRGGCPWRFVRLICN